MDKNQVLITGGDGYLGLRLARTYLELTEDHVLLFMRANDKKELQMKKEAVSRQLSHFQDRVTYHSGDLAKEHPFNPIDPEGIRLIIHSAAVTEFNVDKYTAQKINVEGTEKILHFANRCPSLKGLALLSTVYASGLKSGFIEEAPLNDKAGFSNHYEWSKWASEMKLLTQFSHLPWRIFRVATIISDDDEGHVTQQNAFHNTLKLFYYGLLSLITGKMETPLYFVTGEFAIKAIFALMNHSPNQSIYHVAHTKGESITLGELIDLAFETFGQEQDFRLRRILKPLYSDAESFDLLVDGVRSFGWAIVNQAVSSIAPFAKQLFISKEIQNQELVSALSGYRAPDPRQLIRNTCKILVLTRWGRKSRHAIQ